MKRFKCTFSTALLAAALTLATAQTPFPDIAPCHWAADAVTEIAGTPEVETNQARTSVYLAENAVQQVFEGLRCEAPRWSRAFLVGEPESWPGEPGPVDFALQVSNVQLAQESGTALVEVVLTAAGQTVDRSGQVDLVFEEGIWRVSYDSLAQLDLPVFP